MKTIKLIFVILVAFPFMGNSQNESKTCSVLLESISDYYDGECKKGLAHGKGTAKGIDSYTGNFKKGLPQGNGVYVWANGNSYDGQWKKGELNGFGTMTYAPANGDSTQTGFWKYGKYIGKERDPKKYSVASRKNIERVSFNCLNAEGKKIEIVFNRPGAVKNLDIISNSGSTVNSATLIGCEDVIFPVQVIVRFTKISHLGTELPCETEFTIYTPGYWRVNLNI